MDQTYTSMMAGIPAALGIWLALLGVSAVAFALLAVIAGRGRRRAPVPAASLVPRNAATRRAFAAARAARVAEPSPVAVPDPGVAMLDNDDRRYAEEIAIAAARAGVTADRRQAEWEGAQHSAEAAWQAYEAADAAARRAIRAAAFPTPQTPLTPAEFATRERYLHRAAQAAHARGEISTDQLIDALSHRNEFDPRLHPFEQDALLRRFGRDRLLRVYQTAAGLERAAWREADLAQAAKRSLDREAAEAARKLAPQDEPTGEARRLHFQSASLALR